MHDWLFTKMFFFFVTLFVNSMNIFIVEKKDFVVSKKLANWIFVIHGLLNVPLEIFCTWYFQKKQHKRNAIWIISCIFMRVFHKYLSVICHNFGAISFYQKKSGKISTIFKAIWCCMNLTEVMNYSNSILRADTIVNILC